MQKKITGPVDPQPHAILAYVEGATPPGIPRYSNSHYSLLGIQHVELPAVISY